MDSRAEQDAHMQALYKQKEAVFQRLLGMADGGEAIDHADLSSALRELKAVDDELNVLTEEMFLTILTDLRP